MKQLFRLWGAALLAVAAATGARAVTYTYQNPSAPPIEFLSSGESYINTFDLTAVGYNSLTMKVVSAVVYFSFADDGDSSSEYISVYLGNSAGAVSGLDNIEVDGNHSNQPASYDTRSAAIDSAALANLQDGVLEYKVTANWGDTYLKVAKIVAEVQLKSSVPETSGTFALLALGLAGLASLRRQLARTERPTV